MRKLLFMAVLLAVKLAPAFGQTDWKLRADNNGIKVYSSIIPSSKIKAIKVEATFDASAQQLAAVVMDVSTSTEWVSHLKSAILIKRVSANELYYYSEVDLPWPAANRDFVAHLTVSQDPDTKVITVDGPAVPGYMPVKKGIVRITNSTGKWIITPLGQSQAKVEYSIHVDPGGSLPSWLVNMFSTQTPMEVFKNLRAQLQKPESKNMVLALMQ
ncbi:MAG TPA: START domain-containing protein [Mucilaginibacter sp.]|jgi:ribosome-associated toxin RatA of RatAB toxin-antitoxin module|nr:START domain-containing protein [Mucilaginibacter sp.]